MGLGSIENALRCGRLHWYSHVQPMDPDTWPRKVDKTIVTGNNPRGRPMKTYTDKWEMLSSCISVRKYQNLHKRIKYSLRDKPPLNFTSPIHRKYIRLNFISLFLILRGLTT